MDAEETDRGDFEFLPVGPLKELAREQSNSHLHLEPVDPVGVLSLQPRLPHLCL